MSRIIYVLFGILVVFFKRDEKTFALAAWSIQTQSLPEGYLEESKVEFSKPVVEALLRYSGFHRKFGVPYLYINSALTYATEIAKATAYSPLFSSSEGIEDFALKHLLRMVLPCSPVYCPDVNCVANTIGEILAEIITDGGFVTHRVSSQIIKMYAGNLAGNILWRLSRLPDPDSHMSEYLKDAPPELINDYAELLRFLSLGIRNSTIISEFYEDRGIDDTTAMILVKSVCGSRFLNFKLGYASELTTKLLEAHTFGKKVLPKDLSLSESFSVVSSIIGEIITFGMIRQGYLKGDEDLEETSRDLLKMILLGITTSKMDLGSSHSVVKYLPSKKRSLRILKQTVLEMISSELYNSDIFKRLFNNTHISFDDVEEYASAMTAGLTHNMTNMSDELPTAIAEHLENILLPIAKSTEGDPSKDIVKLFSDGISKALVDINSKLKFVDFNRNSSSVLNTFHEIVQNILLSLEKIEEIDSQVKEIVIDNPLKSVSVPRSIFDMVSRISNFFSAIS